MNKIDANFIFICNLKFGMFFIFCIDQMFLLIGKLEGEESNVYLKNRMEKSHDAKTWS